MIDLNLFQTTCDHRIQEFIEIDGISPNFVARLSFPSTKNKEITTVCEFSQFDGINLYSASTPGITNYEFSDDGQRLLFGTQPVTPTTNFPDPNPDFHPVKRYLCTYVSLLEYCPKCFSTGKVQDVVFDTAGRLETLQGANKVKQQVVKAIMTAQNANLLDVNYGSKLPDLVGKKLTPFLAANIQQTIQDSLNHLINVQATQADLPDNEKIVQVSNLLASRDVNDSRRINISVSVVTADYQTITSGVSLKQ